MELETGKIVWGPLDGLKAVVEHWWIGHKVAEKSNIAVYREMKIARDTVFDAIWWGSWGLELK